MVDWVDIKSLNLEELSGVVSLYPWYGVARKELCRRMTDLGAWTQAQYAEAALYVGSRGIIAAMINKAPAADCSDKDIDRLLKAFLGDGEEEGEEAAEGEDQEPASPSREVFVVGGDYFSQAQYNKVKKSSDSIFASFASKARDEVSIDTRQSDTADFCTETLAQIYLEQGYPDKAKEIYSKLILRYPEKSVYFASLIERLDN